MDPKTDFKICIVGSACVDYFFEVKDFPKKGETISAKNYFNAAGGKPKYNETYNIRKGSQSGCSCSPSPW